MRATLCIFRNFSIHNSICLYGIVVNDRHNGKKKEGEPCGGQFGDCEAGLECQGICVHGKYFSKLSNNIKNN